ncbi:hypothetical protein [Curtobacterium poinsettiae]|uniref:AbiEi antitoxin C-terminal domain-containing protein n=1 Tax=Curtobacterium poinsettiae TaxID=159612 RepID=A0ABT3S7E3_9MICO|nr:hypothetical protein [Curtobacterium flaccumfaciens]MBT1610643.1 hypothetical protein [Curtobacterium flaccumfaciens pv. poinsettiae]MCX2850141.1 hypothetical protein [Curtobacterium flaccumfaciens pv. poinsettiae]UXN18330.1 hypothetical protein N8D78_16080 [Curtobacterium flaccumfaciens pv. poinsettiae]
MLEIAASQEGFLTVEQLEQLEQSWSRVDARTALRAMARAGELNEVVPGVWLHVVADPAAGNIDVAARAAWVALEPAVPLWERARRDRARPDCRAVIGGGAAYRRWGFGSSPWPAVVHLPAGTSLPPVPGEVGYVWDGRSAEDVSWFGPFPYIGVEAVLAGQFGYTVDFDEVALDLAEAHQRFGHLSMEALLRRLEVIAASNAWDGPLSAEAIFAALLTRACR